jgi:hypothetical protein
MLRHAHDMRGAHVSAADEDVGHLLDLYLDDQQWAIRYLVVDSGHWFHHRRVLIAPTSVRHVDWRGDRVDLILTRAQVRSEPADAETPAARPREAAFFDSPRAYWLGDYWLGPELWGRPASPLVLSPMDDGAHSAPRDAPSPSPLLDAPHLRSTRQVTGYAIRGLDGEAGHLLDVLVDDAAWTVRYLVVNTGPGRRGHEVFIPPSSVQWVSWL